MTEQQQKTEADLLAQLDEVKEKREKYFNHIRAEEKRMKRTLDSVQFEKWVQLELQKLDVFGRENMSEQVRLQFDLLNVRIV